MTHRLPLPALDGRDPLGFLATLGLLRLLTQHTDADVRLSFDDTTAQATLHSPYRTCDQVADHLTTITATMADDAVIPGLPANFPLAKSGTKGSDPMRVARDDYPKLHTTVAEIGDEAVQWLSCIVTDLGRDDKGRAALTPYSAPSGQQTVRSFFGASATQIRAQPHHLLAALTAWRRVTGFTGEYLDHRVLHSATDHPRGEPGSEHGVPGATWLAIMALPLLRLAGNGTTATATLWRPLSGRRRIMLWPLWRQPLDLTATTALIEHPNLNPTSDGNRITVLRNKASALGVFAVAAAHRRPVEGRKSAGVLVPLPVTLIDT
ncbi:type I-G CRISPR-associated protein, Cas3-extension family [Micromonospora globbae]|uniref:type I-G CRISPR-associated protein, Cas3-extension family n=1 Tax=Micromonospora globbae TaxID=1894969 RepID=UPI00341B1413